MPRFILIAFRFFVFVCVTLVESSAAYSQLTNVTNDQATPTPGAGHDYIGMLSETVNPANGSVSLRLQVPVPKGRGLAIPFAFAYDSNGVHHLQGDGTGGSAWLSNTAFISKGGWSYTVPQLTAAWLSSGCDYSTDFVFQDPSGGRHALGISDTGNSCGPAGFPLYPTLLAGDDFFSASLPYQNAVLPPTSVADADGTVFYFSHFQSLGYSPFYGSLPDYVEDRNGNKIVITNSNPLTYTDTLGRTALSISGFGVNGSTVSVSGLSTPYSIGWGAATANYSVHPVYLDIPGPNPCYPPPTVNGSQGIVTTITLPNGSSYQFFYDSIYGVLNKVVYPAGGYVRYVWTLNSQSESATYAAGPDSSGNTGGICDYRLDSPAIVHRYVSFDGAREVLQQDFNYSTNWPSSSATNWTAKQTTITTSDLLRGSSWQTIYTYTPFWVPSPPNTSDSYSPQVPLEQTITYKDVSGNTLRTVNKTWYDQYLLASEQLALENGQTSKTTYSYANNNTRAQITEKDEYDYGQGGPGPLMRKTITAYQTFPNTPIYPNGASIFDRPSSEISYSGGGTRTAETDYSYDQTGVVTATTPTGTHDETNYGTSYNNRANVTTVSRQCSTGCTTNAITTYTYDETGQARSITDPCGNATCSDMTGANHTTTYSYADNFDSPPSSSTNAYVTQISSPATNGISHIQKFKYAYSDGQVIQSTDQNNQVTSYFYADTLRRLTETDYPDGGKTTLTYNDAAPSPSVTTSRLMNTSNQYFTSTATMDGIGHIVKSLLTTDPDCTSGDRTDTTYDGLGRVLKVSNPYCTTSDSTYGLTTYTYDALGRATQVTHPDNSTLLTTYTGRATQVQDEGNGTQRITRISQTDALGRLISLCEVAPGPFIGAGGYSSPSLIGSGGSPVACGQDIAGTGFLTTYQYDTLDNLLQVNQTGIAPRTFSYDSLSRLASATNPESGTISYTYDANSNSSSKTDGRNVLTNYGYDALNRLTGKTYSDGTPAVSFSYDQTSALGVTLTNTTGRKSSESTAGSSPTGAVFSYDPMGRVVDNSQCTPQNCGSGIFAIQYTQYDFLGDLISATNAAGVTFTYSYNTVGRLTGISTNFVDSSHPGTLLSNGHYNAFGYSTGATLGNGVTESWSYNNRGWQQSRTATMGAATPYSFNITSFAPNGDTLSANDSANGNWAYTYDPFNRLVGSNQNSGAAVYSYVYDRFGNRWQQHGPNLFIATFTGNNPSNPQNNNRVDGYPYDAAGNLGGDGTHTYTYDAENRLTQVDSGSTASYVYNAEGQRVRKTASGSTLDYLYDSDGHKVADVDPTGVFLRGELYAGGGHFAVYAPDPGPTGATFFTHTDWLGTERVRTDMTGAVCETITSLPFGDGQSISDSCGDSNGDVSPLHFTGKERDSESGLDYFGARYDSSSMGRFMSPDEPLMDQEKANPQSWNLYSYVRNNSLNAVDPDGHDCVYLNSSGNGVDSIDHNSNSGECSKEGGFWANGTVEAAWWVKTDPNSDTVHIFSHYKDIVGQTWAGPGWSHGDKYANVIPRVQAWDESIEHEMNLGIAAAFNHGPGVPPEEAEEGEGIARYPVGRRGRILDMGPEGEEALPPTNSPARIGGRDYSGHALDGMQEAGLTPTVVEEVIAAGTKSPGSSPGTTKSTAQGVNVVTNQSGKVVTVYYGPK